MIKLALIRHGHTSWNRQGRIQGHTDIPLADDVVDDLAHYQLPSAWAHADIVCSPLQRARQTAALIGVNRPVLEPALTEMNWGDWEGLRGIDLAADADSGFRHLEHWGWDYHAPNGESPRSVWCRLQPWLDGLRQDTVAVCHIGIMRVLLARAYRWDFIGTPPFEIKRKRLYLLQIGASLEVAEPCLLRLGKAD